MFLFTYLYISHIYWVQSGMSSLAIVSEDNRLRRHGVLSRLLVFGVT